MGRTHSRSTSISYAEGIGISTSRTDDFPIEPVCKDSVSKSLEEIARQLRNIGLLLDEQRIGRFLEKRRKNA